jgi:hypothetical protein|tara:strand:+ start:1122 stop:1412 length:291 start_codon:yes stop_codon:yes gene_type:complete
MSNGVRTRSGRISKKPQRLELKEDVEDDFREDEYNSDVDLLQSDDEDFCTDDEEDDEDEEEEDDDLSDGDENGNLKGFVVEDEDDDEDFSDEDEDE